MDRAAAGAGIIINVAADSAVRALSSGSAQTGCHVVIMHMQGTPETMQNDPKYDFAPVEIYSFSEKPDRGGNGGRDTPVENQR